MQKFYITFGQVHVHSIEGKTIDKDCMYQLEAKDKSEAHDKAMKLFDGIFHQVLDETRMKEARMFFPRGIIK